MAHVPHPASVAQQPWGQIAEHSKAAVALSKISFMRTTLLVAVSGKAVVL